MTGPARQRTRLQRLERRLGGTLLGQLSRSWRRASLTLLGLLVGFYLAQNLTTLLLIHMPGGRPGGVLLFVLLCEVLVRLRTRFLSDPPGLGWVITDNLRLGATYALVLEAFKLGT